MLIFDLTARHPSKRNNKIMKRNLLAFSLLFILIPVYCQQAGDKEDTLGWHTGGSGNLTFSQVALYQWSAGGEPSLSGVALFNLYVNHFTLTSSWRNTLDLGYGLNRQGEMTRKSNDKIEFTSQYGLKASEKWEYSGLLNFRTQFANGYQYFGDTARSRISDFFAPAYLTASLGMNYHPDKHLSVFLSPVALKLTFVMDDSLSAEGQFGVDPGKQFRAEFGGYVKVGYDIEVAKNVTLASKIDFFSNYLDHPQNIDINFEILLDMKVNEFLSATVSTNGIYDDDIELIRKDGTMGPGWQIKEVLGVGLSYKF